jgi:hypothetical protein
MSAAARFMAELRARVSGQMPAAGKPVSTPLLLDQTQRSELGTCGEDDLGASGGFVEESASHHGVRLRLRLRLRLDLSLDLDLSLRGWHIIPPTPPPDSPT